MTQWDNAGIQWDTRGYNGIQDDIRRYMGIQGGTGSTFKTRPRYRFSGNQINHEM